MKKPMSSLSWRNQWPEGVRGGVTKVKENKKGKGSYKRSKEKSGHRSYQDGHSFYIYT